MRYEQLPTVGYKPFPTMCNEHYDVISVLHHALEGAWKCETYIRDAEKAGDETLAQFFREAQQEQCARAEQAKALLKHRIGPLGSTF